ncbi:retrovirus-related pol polyprotein from transposon TNT 1-94 [Tanacetum coccineum]
MLVDKTNLMVFPEIVKDGKVIGRGIRKKGLYVMKLGTKPEDQICLATINENSTLWHRRLGHANMRLIQSLVSKELVRNLLKLKFDQHFCEACKIGKQAHASHNAKNVVSMTRCLELLHMDLFGPSSVRSYGGNLYTLVIVDEYSRTDHGREFDNEVQFGEFCNANGKTPYELLRGRKPTLDYFRVFGSKCFILNNKDYLTKFDPKSYEGVFLGYSQNSKAYIILNKHTMKIKESLNVTFDETPPPSKTSPLADNDVDEEEAIKVNKNKNLENDIEDETLEIDEVVNIKESRNHPLENLVAQGYNQQEGIDYDETYAPVARLEYVRIFLAYACALDFKLFQMDVKSAFLNGFINEEVYAAQPLGFIDFEKPDHVYKLKKALYGLKQAPKAWYDRLKAFLIKHENKKGMTCQDMCDEFAKIMHDEFEMSMMGELNFFLGLQIKQMEDGIFFNQSKYIKEMLKKFGLEDSKPMKTPMSSDTKLMKDEECESVDSTKYRGMIGSLLYLTASRPDIMFSVWLCARLQEDPKTSHLEAKQTALAISTTKAEYISARKACQQALWMKQALIDYDIQLDDIPIMSLRCSFHHSNKLFSFTLEEFGHILGIPFKGHCSYSDKWSLDYLEVSTPTKGHYQTIPPSPSVIKTLIQTPRQGQITRVRNKKTINVDENKILNRKIQNHMSSWVKIIRENVLCLGGHRDHVPSCLCHMLYCIETSTKYNLAFFILKRMESIRNSPKANLPYGMLLTRLFTHIVSNFPELSNDRYILCDRVMHPLAPHYERKTRSVHDTKRCRSPNPNSSNVLDHSSSSHHVDENDEEPFHSNTPSPSQLINSLSNVVPRVFENPPHKNQTMLTYQTKILNHQSQHRDEHRKGLRSIGRALKNAMRGTKK